MEQILIELAAGIVFLLGVGAIPYGVSKSLQYRKLGVKLDVHPSNRARQARSGRSRLGVRASSTQYYTNDNDYAVEEV